MRGRLGCLSSFSAARCRNVGGNSPLGCPPFDRASNLASYFSAPMRPALPSNRSFGWTFTSVVILFGAYGLWHGGAHSPWLLALAAVTALVTLTREAWLTPLNRAWMKLGELLGKVVSPVVLGIIFFA